MPKTFFASAPGRVNLIGEHTDYNGGMVLPAALSLKLDVSLTPRRDDAVIISATNYEAPANRTLEEQATSDWSDPCVGAIREANELGLLTGGAELTVHSNIPEGAGLSSSAALIVAILKAAREAAGGSQSDVDLAVAARRVENDYMGVPCGIMDQMAVALAPSGTAMALDTKSLDYTLIPLVSTHAMVVVHSGISRKLTDGRYAARKRECDEAKAFFGTDELCLIDPAIVAQSNHEESFVRRAMHCATEHRRVVAAVEALKSGDIEQLGQLMNESHISMRDNFEISLPEIDQLVESAVEVGAVGARLTGGGFGGCIVACVRRGHEDLWAQAIQARHPHSIRIDAKL